MDKPKNQMINEQLENIDFKTINYLGSKLRILDFIEDKIDYIDPTKGAVCDIFAGSGSVSYRLSKNRRVIASDIQEYSRVLCSALLNPVSFPENFKQDFMRDMKGDHFNKLYLAIKPLIDLEQDAINSIQEFESLKILTDIIEDGSIAAYTNQTGKTVFEKINESRLNLTKHNISLRESLVTTYFGGVYFSYLQAIQLDVILCLIDRISIELKDMITACLLSTASNIVNTVGKHFAQPIRPRDSSGKIKTNLGKAILRDRTIDVKESFYSWVDKYSKIKTPPFKNNILKCDYSDIINDIPEDVTVIYADPPYTRDHYSRFYHLLETLALRDLPEISTTKINGEEKISRGLYRKDRHQSPFCIKNQVISSFDFMFKQISAKNKKLVLSYSPYDKTKKTHPRVVTMDKLIELANQYFENVEVVSAGLFSHNKLNSTKNLLEASNNAEVLIICY